VNLKIVVESNEYSIKIPQDVASDGHSFFEKMDEDMGKGWQMDREWVASPSTRQRCQIAASRIADAISVENETLASLMAAYILKNMPAVTEVHIDTQGEMSETDFISR
jgi:hypothetical protein